MASLLVVDDEEQIRTLLRKLFSLHGYAVETASDGDVAIDMVQKKPFDLMLIDRMMPKMSGIDAVSVIRSSPKFKTMKILMVTSAELIEEIDEAYKAGVDGYVIKPFDINRLLDKVAETLKK
jgi:DNA-binding response OmpR family regulator